jgi:hypothetical protein
MLRIRFSGMPRCSTCWACKVADDDQLPVLAVADMIVFGGSHHLGLYFGDNDGNGPPPEGFVQMKAASIITMVADDQFDEDQLIEKVANLIAIANRRPFAKHPTGWRLWADEVINCVRARLARTVSNSVTGG